jgi:uncharacterized membrane protein
VQRADWVSWLIAFAVFAAYSVISISRYRRLEPGSWDLGIFTEYVKQIAHLHGPVVSIRGAGFNLLGDHFQPIVALVAPFFRLLPSPVTLLLAQALLTALSVIPVSRAARAKLGITAGWVIGAAYGFSWGLQEMIDFDFHEIAFAVSLLACSLSALLRGKTRAAVIWALPLVFIKEDQGFTVAALGLIILVKAWRAQRNSEADAGLFLLLWGIAWSLVEIVVIIPHFNVTHQYPYWNDGGAIGAGAGHHMVSALADQVTHAYRQKLETTAMILLPVAFLALRSPIALVAVPSLALRFLSVNSYFWGTTWHYNATVMPIAFIAAIDTLARVRAARTRAGPVRRALATATIRLSLAAMLAIAAVLAFRFPLDGLGNAQTYLISQHVQAENAAMAKVPDGTTVETTLTMLAPLAARDDTFWIGTSPNPAPQYIVFDESNSGWNPAPGNVLTFVEQRHPGVAYQQIFLDDDVYVFHRSEPSTGG